MPGDKAKTFLGFGFGAIQAGLFLLEAFRSGRFGKAVIAEVVPEVVRCVREQGGKFHLNIAHSDRVETVELHPVEIEDPSVGEDRQRLVQAVVEASEIATAVPSVSFYSSNAPGSIHRILAKGLAERFGSAAPGRRPPVVIYAAENHNEAAEILQELVLSEIAPTLRGAVAAQTQFLNTVIGKMSGLVQGTGLRDLAPLAPGQERAFLVESFNRILISKIRFDKGAGFRRGIEVFEEKENLLPFEEAKLYGHNAAHALAAYLAALLGLTRMEELKGVDGALNFVRGAFLEESGRALIAKWRGADRLFSPEGFLEYADDLLGRMLNPHLGDLVERVARDTKRKLGWDDRLVGTMRLALEQGVTPRRFSLGAAAALALHAPQALEGKATAESLLAPLWPSASPDPEMGRKVVGLIEQALGALGRWRREGGPTRGFPSPAVWEDFSA